MLDFFAIAALCLVWGGTWLAIKIGLSDAPPFLSAAARFLIACLLLFPFIWRKKLALPKTKKEISAILVTGFCMYALSYALVYWAEQYVPSGLTAIIFSTLPFLVALFAHFLLPAEPFTLPKTVGMVVGFAGIGLIFWEGAGIAGSRQFLGMLLLLGSPLATSYANVLTKRDLHDVHPAVIAGLQMALGFVLLSVLGFAFERFADFHLTHRSLGSLAYLATFGSVFAFATYYWLLKRVEATKLSLIAFVTPVVALIVGALFGDEHLSAKIASGSALVVLGIAIATQAKIFSKNQPERWW